MSTKAKIRKTEAAEQDGTATDIRRENALGTGVAAHAGTAGDLAGSEAGDATQGENGVADQEEAESGGTAAPVGNAEATQGENVVADENTAENRNTTATTPNVDIVHVYCKLPAGLAFQLAAGQRLVLNGSRSSRLVGGYGVTRVPSALWAQVKSLFGNMPAFTRGLIFDESTASRGLARAREQADIKNGFEGIDPKNPGTGVTPDDGK